MTRVCDTIDCDAHVTHRATLWDGDRAVEAFYCDECAETLRRGGEEVISLQTSSKLWHDDIRRPPDESWIWARTNEDAKLALRAHRIEECSLDHDLGLHLADPDVQDADLQRGWDVENDGYTLVKWMCEHPQFMPGRITIHSWNPPGAARMAALLADHGIPCIVKPYARS